MGPMAASRMPAIEGVASSAISARGIIPSDKSEITKYSTKTDTKPKIVARPTSRLYLARPEMVIAPSIPTNTHTRATMVDDTCVRKSGPPGSPQKFSMKMVGLNLPRRRIETMKRPSGTNFAKVTITFTPVASFTPRDTKKAMNHKKIEAQIKEGRLFPSPNTGKKYPSAPKSIMA